MLITTNQQTIRSLTSTDVENSYFNAGPDVRSMLPYIRHSQIPIDPREEQTGPTERQCVNCDVWWTCFFCPPTSGERCVISSYHNPNLHGPYNHSMSRAGTGGSYLVEGNRRIYSILINQQIQPSAVYKYDLSFSPWLLLQG